MHGVVLITGVMASGKSTVAQALASRLPRAAHVRGDVFRRMVVSGRADYVPDGSGGVPGASGSAPVSGLGFGASGPVSAEAREQLLLRYRLSAATADAYADAGFTAVVQDVVLGEDLAGWVGMVRTRPLYVVVLAPDARAVAAREAGRAKRGYGAWSVEELDRWLRERTPRIGLWLDTSGMTPDETVEKILTERQRAGVE
ncbi:AAA family ATPase [Streptomyces acidiscabies]|uniref:AAA family ATPase n=1 Tax=Streptomyces acidiscabies TaxID=42234 RepID=A0AAP6B766_9ACTN|nr:AAA family ATPase [Streptomyces acidiscabies]MBP5939313.1 AAA family ATPase [Streptomyces sp. LBUM 1476]MBZ3910446.1 AAA family ATPase [Streptomyces acidiscabies]MDX2959444.1 AAA family ATPase [Streptomyces acidiscabies]MDX3019268.1 AAA family ATPase [Streptomyces acidiscabies]MDX3790651.1 AAA family ATPase [Streptomyces acidiscabies]